MQWMIPGTTLEGTREEASRVSEKFQALFLAGGLTLSQVASISGLEPYTVQNWVKRGFLPPPQGKRYSMEQLCRLLNMNILRGNMLLEQVTYLMSYLNGDLADESDDLVDDTMLYFLFVRLAAKAGDLGGSQSWDEALDQVVQEYSERAPGAREKLRKVLKIMLTIWFANQLRVQGEKMISELS